MSSDRKRHKLYFGQRIPKMFDPKRIHPEFREYETPEKIDAEQKERIKILEDSRDNNYDYSSVAEVLKSCTGKHPCKSAACAKCGADYHRWFSACSMEAMQDCERVYLVTYAPDPEYPPVYPVELWPDRLRDRFIRRLEREVGSEVKVVGFVEISINQTLRCLVPHVHAIVFGATRKQLKAAHPGKPNDRLIYRPWVVSKKIPKKRRPKAFTYSSKVFGSRREFKAYWSCRAWRLKRLAKSVSRADLDAERLASLSEHFHADLAIVRGFKTRRGGRLYTYPIHARRKSGYRQFKRRKIKLSD